MQTHLILRFTNIVRTPEGAVERWQPLGLSVDEDVLWKVGGDVQTRSKKTSKTSNLQPEVVPVDVKDPPMATSHQNPVDDREVEPTKRNKNARKNKRSANKVSHAVVKKRNRKDETRVLPVGPLDS